jgi:hypothetical protein
MSNPEPGVFLWIRRQPEHSDRCWYYKNDHGVVTKHQYSFYDIDPKHKRNPPVFDRPEHLENLDFFLYPK